MAAIDIVMPVRNGAAYIGDAIRSVIGQTERNWRLLVFNHASTDLKCVHICPLSSVAPRA